jgi:hypothetical protein
MYQMWIEKFKPPHVHPHPFFTPLQKYIQKHVKSNENRGGMGVRGGPPVRNLTKQLEIYPTKGRNLHKIPWRNGKKIVFYHMYN